MLCGPISFPEPIRMSCAQHMLLIATQIVHWQGGVESREW